MQATRTWVLIADGGRARVLSQTGKGHPLVEVEGLALHADLPRSHEIGRDRPGRSYESHGTARHAVEGHSDPHDSLEHAFLVDVAERLDARLAAGAFDRLVLVAPPRALAVLRQVVSKPLHAVLDAEVAKDLTKTPDKDVAALLGGALR